MLCEDNFRKFSFPPDITHKETENGIHRKWYGIQLPGALVTPKLKKTKNSRSEKMSYVVENGKFLSKTVLIFSYISGN